VGVISTGGFSGMEPRTGELNGGNGSVCGGSSLVKYWSKRSKRILSLLEIPELGVKCCGAVTGGSVTAGAAGISCEDLNETGEILGILFNTPWCCSPSFGVTHGADVCREFANVGSAAPKMEHATLSL